MDTTSTDLTIAQVAEELGMTKAGVYKLIQRGKLPSDKTSERKTRVKRADLDQFINRHQSLATRRQAPLADPAVLRAEFEEQHDKTPEDWIEAWKHGEQEDTPEQMNILVRAVALRAYPGQEPAVATPAEHEWVFAMRPDHASSGAFETVGHKRRSRQR